MRRVLSENTVECSASAGFRRSSESDSVEFGKVLIIKSLGLSKIVYSALNTCVPRDIVIKIREKIFAFLWNKKSDTIKRDGLYQDYSRGGLNMTYESFATLLDSPSASLFVLKLEINSQQHFQGTWLFKVFTFVQL